MRSISRRDFARLTVFAALSASVPLAAHAFGGPSGPSSLGCALVVMRLSQFANGLIR